MGRPGARLVASWLPGLCSIRYRPLAPSGLRDPAATGPRRCAHHRSTAGGGGGSGGQPPEDGSPEEADTLRDALHRAIRGFNPEAVWGRFNEIAQGRAGARIVEQDVCRVLQTFNNQYMYERGPEPLSRAGAVLGMCERRGLQFTTAFFYNECIRHYVAKRERGAALAIKRRMDAGEYGPGATTDIFTYAALLSDPHAEGPEDLARMAALYDEMIGRGIAPNELVQKPLLRAARRAGEHRLVKGLLEARGLADAPPMLSTTAARLAGNKAQSYIALDKLNPAIEQLRGLLMRQIPRDTRPVPGAHDTAARELNIPLEYSRTREAFFIYLRSLYESIIRVNLARRNTRHAHEMLEDMRRNCYLPPTKGICYRFVRYHAKRKNIQRLREIHDMMLQDGVPLDEYVYTKLITACMFSPKPRLLRTLAARAGNGSAESPPPDPPLAPPSTTRPAVAVSTHVAATGEEEPDMHRLPSARGAAEGVDALVYHPRDCIRFFEDMLLDYNVDPKNIRDEGYLPNVHITNSVMRAYLALEKPVLALREFFRYRFHQNQRYPRRPPPDVVAKPKAIAHVFRMALDAARATGDARIAQRVHKCILLWEVALPPDPADARRH
ncbi:hypothetical protein H4R18_004518 [Coemansia javaensis]|uniref:Pentatricopeptide repeat-containing protein n=1 Tax=Coemansia javaensis TaxID=2761396 RepID=A0A9W8H8T1_9FUNG|nr:hypothetical protein H4R18_004518 [Coemansia javaensis]